VVSDVMAELERTYLRKKEHHYNHLKELEIAQEGEACGIEDQVDWDKY